MFIWAVRRPVCTSRAYRPAIVIYYWEYLLQIVHALFQDSLDIRHHVLVALVRLGQL